MTRLLVLILIAITYSCPATLSEEYKFEWRQSEKSLALLNHGKIVWQFNEGSEGSKPYFHPVSLVDGTILTEPRPVDHPWHLALWFSWKYLNGVNYWEEDTKTHQAEGITKLVDYDYVHFKDYTAGFSIKLAYHPRDARPVLRENRTIQISCPDQNGDYYIDWESQFIAAINPVKFDRTPILGEENGVPYGGYAGLSVRFSNQISDVQVAAPDGLQSMNIEKHRLSRTAKWLDYTFALKNGQHAGIGIIDKASNPRHPTPWYAIVNPDQPFYYFSPAFLHDETFTLKPGKPLKLHYRILIHQGRTNPENMEHAFEALNKKFTNTYLAP